MLCPFLLHSSYHNFPAINQPIMKLTLTFLAALASTGLASPIMEKRANATTTGYTTGDTASDVDDGVCAPLTVIFARGTFEAGNIGTIIGPPLFKALSSSLDKNVALQGVTYDASVAGDVELGAVGGPKLAAIAEQALSQCPDTKLALSGYSQGGLLIHHAINQDGLASADVSAIVIFGDPGMYTPSIWDEDSN